MPTTEIMSPSRVQTSQPAAFRSSLGTWSTNRAGTRDVQVSPGSVTWVSASMMREPVTRATLRGSLRRRMRSKWWASIGVLAVAVVASRPVGASGDVDGADASSASPAATTTTLAGAPTSTTTPTTTSPTTTTAPPAPPPPLAPQNGYWVLGSDGGVFTFGGVAFN